MDHLPPAPTPPSGMAPNANAARSNNLLNLLKFSGAGQAASAQQARQEPYQHHHHQSSQLSQQEHEAYQYQQSQQHRQTQPYHHQEHRSELPDEPAMSIPAHILAPAPAAQDPSGLLRALMGGAHEVDEAPSTQNQPASTFTSTAPSEDTRTYLLNLLNRPKPSQDDQPLLSESSHQGSYQTQHAENHHDRNAHHLLDNSSGQPRHGSFDYDRRSYEQQQSSHQGSYNPYPPHLESAPTNSYGGYGSYDAPQQQSQNHTPKSGSATLVTHGGHSAGQSPAAAAPSFLILKKAQESPAGSAHGSDRKSFVQERSPLASPEHLRRKIQSSASPAEHIPYATPGSTVSHTSVPYTEKHKDRETVSDAVHDIAEKASREAEEAVTRAEGESTTPTYAKDLNDMNSARTQEEFDESAQHTAQAIKKELDRDENSGLLESILSPEAASEVHKIVDDVAGEGVADSWESADQDEIVVIEEEAPAPVKVYNFPMKPWISITVQETTDLPQFRDESIMDIARLKKEFDQIDRNLYTATEIYMVYGMSKAGGLRVIRQDDGRDAKIFTDTKDRIFNVAVSVTPSDHAGVHREAIIGTGISGTVYWVQIRNGDKDHIEDPHPEQYGFALPPMSSHEGDAPGGVLKTRARSSTIHPEFFAVGRGKSINIIWPEYIMQNNLFKPGHDRVVDTEQLAKQCSLKINTGKAGKDFTFSQDDSVIVSLDKSGRIKFWDVRELTAAKEGGNPRAPTPLHTSLEVKEPLLTLTSTPEGEKAWPTSVLLVDKLRPYQKRCALRYMIVGMKQNHTLQLWDLALGKPVQEFNLPHSKESDAVCSVMYHPPTGMIVIGHPTRNSIYFAHLSAPKYNLKSVSQVEYIQRLITQDSLIPQPDSTAVISGVREYSFANRGILRSLDILPSPAMSQDSEEPTLFELYAMHSKGVACLLVKQTELGWSKDNKVLAPVQAVDAGVITISKLKPLPPQTAEAPHQEISQPIVTRHVQKEPVALSTPSQDEAAPARARGSDTTAPAKAKQQESPAKDEDAPAPAPVKEEKQEKQERKGRKKKASAAAAAAAAAASTVAETSANGGAQSPRVAPKDSKTAAVSSSAVGISQESVEAYLSTMESRLNSSFAGTINAGLKSLHGKIEDGHREREKDFEARQVNLLNMVSEVLNENTQKVLESLIQEQFSGSVIPAISDVVSKAMADQFSASLNQQVSSAVQREIHRALPSATQQALHGGEFVKTLTSRVSANVAAAVQHEVVDSLSAKLSSSFTAMTRSACQGVAEELQRQHRAELDSIQAQRLTDHNKMDQLSSVVTQLSTMVSALASSQEQFQGEFLRFQQQATKQQQQHAQQQAAQQQAYHQAQQAAAHQAAQQQQAALQAQAQAQQQAAQQAQQQAHHAQQHISPAQQGYGGQGYGQQQQMRAGHGHSQQGGSQNYGSIQSPEGTSQRAATHYASSHVGSLAPSHAASLAHSHAPSQALTVSNVGSNSVEYDQTLADRIMAVESLLKDGKVEEALLTWLQSGRESVMFDRFISKFGPQLLEGMPGLLLLTVATTISHNLESSTRDRIAWLESIINNVQDDFGGLDVDARRMAPKIFELIVQKTESLFVRISSEKGNDPILRTLSQLINTSKKLLELSMSPHFAP
ncbi:hypothetical protein B0T11DRAFT_333343 [Plectosphaerella cucumerina]|uniref:EDC4-like protein pdc1 beta-propeller domain-containing protein n=1 Tax=Plectosphaerella cucumerina TaxID=40658 RepID=A0A8K0T5T9_9PEZI|nr:hypothetical protein B0T11DRAFT_333343 [Plectosphaerella cucumerina]